METAIKKEELKRWGFFMHSPGVWYNNNLSMLVKVHKRLNNGDKLNEYDFIHAVYERGRIDGVQEAQENMRQAIGLSSLKAAPDKNTTLEKILLAIQEANDAGCFVLTSMLVDDGYQYVEIRPEDIDVARDDEESHNGNV